MGTIFGYYLINIGLQLSNVQSEEKVCEILHISLGNYRKIVRTLEDAYYDIPILQRLADAPSQEPKERREE